jgi:alcohol dehydrogenase class IV
MVCCHHFAYSDGGETAFSVDASAITFGPGALAEVGDRLAALGGRRVALMTDRRVAALPAMAVVESALKQAGVDVVRYDEVRVEPTDHSFLEAAQFAREGHFDAYVSLGGGSVIDTCKAANLYATHPADFLAYVNPPVGEGRAVPGPLKPHVACPTTCGTGSECTGITIFDLLEKKAKTGIVSRHLRPDQAIIDPTVTASLPRNVVAASAFDVLSHALESYTARPFTARDRPTQPSARPLSQGANPWSDIGCREALRLVGTYLVRAVSDASDDEARGQLMWAATLAGIAFGNSGVHLPHGMSYSVAGLVRDFRPEGYPNEEAMVPHGMSVIVNAPAVFRHTAGFHKERHLEAAGLLGADVNGAAAEDAGDVLAGRIIAMMRDTGMPNGIGGVGYMPVDIPALIEGAFLQQRLLQNAPCAVEKDLLSDLYRHAMSYW